MLRFLSQDYLLYQNRTLNIFSIVTVSRMQVQKMANETGLDFSDQIISLENKYQQVLTTKMAFHLLKEKKKICFWLLSVLL